MRLTDILNEAAGGLKLFHGTSSRALPGIMKLGLTPQTKPESVMRGNLSTIPGYTERMVYLAPTAREASVYAQRLCAQFGGDPVILEIAVLPTDPLHVDDDYIIRQILAAMLASEGHPPLSRDDFDADGDIDIEYSTVGAAHQEWAEMLWTHRDAFYQGEIDRIDEPPTILAGLRTGYAAYRDALQAPWQHGLKAKRDPAVAFAGTIPPDRIRVLDRSGLKRAFRQYQRFGRGTV
jgi:hypothetical protein